MKLKKIKLSFILLSGLGLTGLHAQEAIPSTGGEANGSGGSSSYTVGQVVYTTQAGTNGKTLAQGVQQAYEISVVFGESEAKNINLFLSAYPNPTTDYLTVKVENYKTDNLQYQIFDINGKLLQIIKAEGPETRIPTNYLVPANYFVKVLDKQKKIKVFKFIKIN